MNDNEPTFEDVLQAIELEPVVTRPGEKAGWVYFIACTETRRCKIGHTNGSVESRLRALQTGSAGLLRIMAKQPGTIDTERTLHGRFAAQRVHGEWFEMSSELFAYLCATIWVMTRLCIKAGCAPEDWMLTGLRMLNDGIAELPEDLASLIREKEEA